MESLRKAFGISREHAEEREGDAFDQDLQAKIRDRKREDREEEMRAREERRVKDQRKREKDRKRAEKERKEAEKTRKKEEKRALKERARMEITTILPPLPRPVRRLRREKASDLSSPSPK